MSRSRSTRSPRLCATRSRPPAMSAYREFHRRSIADREGFWAEQAKLIDWHRPHRRVLDYAKPPFAKWFVGGETNLCHNAVDRHLGERTAQKALVYLSTETGEEKAFTYAELHAEEIGR